MDQISALRVRIRFRNCARRRRAAAALLMRVFNCLLLVGIPGVMCFFFQAFISNRDWTRRRWPSALRRSRRPSSVMVTIVTLRSSQMENWPGWITWITLIGQLNGRRVEKLCEIGDELLVILPHVVFFLLLSFNWRPVWFRWEKFSLKGGLGWGLLRGSSFSWVLIGARCNWN